MHRVVGLTLLVALAVAAGCGRSRHRTVGDLVQHLKRAGIKGEYEPLAAPMIGALEGGKFQGPAVSVAIYRFEDRARASSLAASGVAGTPAYANGTLVFVAFEANGRIVKAFRSF